MSESFYKEMSLDLMHKAWPTKFVFETDPICQTYVKPFIDFTISQLKTLDNQRLALAPTQYIFHEHAPRVARLVQKFCLHLGLSEDIARNMYWATLPHDAGKAHVTDSRYKNTAHIWKEFLDKPTPDIFDLRRTHGKLGAEYIANHFANINETNSHPILSLMTDLAENHHECMDGSGPLKKEAYTLTPPVRLVAIIEAFDGYCIKRAHFPANRDTSPTGAIAHMTAKTGQFDQDLLKQFKEFITQDAI